MFSPTTAGNLNIFRISFTKFIRSYYKIDFNKSATLLYIFIDTFSVHIIKLNLTTRLVETA